MCDPVGTHEIAERLGVTRKAVHKWRERDLGFPAPRYMVGHRPAWSWADVSEWCEATGHPDKRIGGATA